jgi:hypothetical protein
MTSIFFLNVQEEGKPITKELTLIISHKCINRSDRCFPDFWAPPRSNFAWCTSITDRTCGMRYATLIDKRKLCDVRSIKEQSNSYVTCGALMLGGCISVRQFIITFIAQVELHLVKTCLNRNGHQCKINCSKNMLVCPMHIFIYWLWHMEILHNLSKVKKLKIIITS